MRSSFLGRMREPILADSKALDSYQEELFDAHVRSLDSKSVGELVEDAGRVADLQRETSKVRIQTEFGITTRAVGRYVYLVTSQPDASGRQGESVVRVDRATGKEAGRCWIEYVQPTFTIDPGGDWLLLQDGAAIEGTRFRWSAGAAR